jgi:hypothetical protein
MPVPSLTKDSVRLIRTEVCDSLAAAHRMTPLYPALGRSPEASSNSRYRRRFSRGSFRALPCGGPQRECGYPLSLCVLPGQEALTCCLSRSKFIAVIAELGSLAVRGTR